MISACYLHSFVIWTCNRSSAWLFGRSEFESRTPLRHCTFSAWNFFAGCGSYKSGRGVHFEELTRDDLSLCPLKILSRVRGSVTDHNGFWIGWLDLLTPSFTITLNYNNLQWLTINDCLRLALFLPGLRVSSLLLWLTCFWFTNP
jgi:hypothetical protein